MPTDEPLTKSDINKLESSLRSTTPFDPMSDQEGGLHCLDVFRRSLLRMGPQRAPRIWIKRRSHAHRVADKRRQQLIHCVTELKEAGIKFKKRKTDRFWDIKFKNGILRMPRLLIHDGTKSLFLNLIAFEQSHLDCSKDITSYLIFMDNLINSPRMWGTFITVGSLSIGLEVTLKLLICSIDCAKRLCLILITVIFRHCQRM